MTDKDEVLEVCPACKHPISEHGKESGCNHIARVQVGATVENCYCPCGRLPNAPAPQPEPEESPELAQAVAQRDQEKCGKCVIHFIDFIAREGSFYLCDLPKGHEGGHRASGNCFKHGYYLGEVDSVPDSVPHCPQCPEFIGEWHSTTAPSQPEFEDSDAGDQAALYAQRHDVKLERENRQLRQQVNELQKLIENRELIFAHKRREYSELKGGMKDR